MEKNNLIVLSDHYLTFVKDQVEAVSGLFSHIHVLVRYNPFAEISNYFPLNRLKPFRKNALVDLTGKPDNISVHLIPVWFLPLDREYKSLGERYSRIVEKFIRKENIRGCLVHAHFIWPNGYVAVRLREKYGIPCVLTAHGYDIYDLPFRDEDWRTKITTVLDHADTVISVSPGNLECINKLNTLTPVSVIPNTYRNDMFHPQDKQECRKKLGLPPDCKILLSIGNLVEEKGQKYLISAMSRLAEYYPGILCIIIGSGKLKNELKRQIRSLNLGNSVLMIGGRPHAEIPQWLNACDVFVLPSLRESFGIVQIEALACGKPVVATINGGSEDILDATVGILVERGDPIALAQGIHDAFDKKWDRDSILGYSKKFSSDVIFEKIVMLYAEYCKIQL